MFAKFLYLFLFTQTIIAAPSKAPWKNWTYCKKPADPTKNNPCLVKAILGVEKDLQKGNSYFGTPSIEPLRINELNMSQKGQKGKAVSVDIDFKNMDIFGLSSWDLKEVISDWDKGSFVATIKLKKPVNVQSDYKASGKVLILPVTGEGRANVTFTDMTVKLYITGKVTERKNKQYFYIDTFKIDLDPKGMTMYLENLFSGNKALGDNINQFLNENWREIMNDIKDPIGEGLGEACRQLSHRVFSKIPYDVLLPK